MISLKIEWLRLVPDSLPPNYPEAALHFGINSKKRDVYIHAESVGLDVEQQLDAIAAGALVFYNSSPKPQSPHGKMEHPYVSIDYLMTTLPDLAAAAQLEHLKPVVLAAYDSDLDDGESMAIPPN